MDVSNAKAKFSQKSIRAIRAGFLWGFLYLALLLARDFLFAIPDAPVHITMGIALAALIIHGWWVLPGLISSIAIEFWVRIVFLSHLSSDYASITPFFAIAVLIPQLCIAYGLMRWLLGKNFEILNDRNIAFFLLISLITSAIAPVIVTATFSNLQISDLSAWTSKFTQHWAAHALGFALVTPIVLIIYRQWPTPPLINTLRIVSPLFLMIIAASLWLYGYTKLEEGRQHSHLQSQIENTAIALQFEVESLSVPLDSARNFLALQQDFDGDTFEHILKTMLNHFPAAVAADFIEPLNEEARLRDNIELTHFNRNGVSEPAPARQFYLALRYASELNPSIKDTYSIFPENSDLTAYLLPLFNALLNSDQTYLATNIYRPFNVRDPSADIMNGYRFALGSLIVKNQLSEFESFDAQIQAVIGLMIVQIDITQLFNEQLFPKLPQNLNACIYAMGTTERILIHSNNASCEAPSSQSQYLSKNFDLFGQNLEFRFSLYGAPEVYYTTNIQLYVLIATVLTCYIFVGWILSFNGRRQETEKIVALRTDQLRKEIHNRKSIEEQLYQSMDMLESVNNGLSGFIVAGDKYQSLDELLYKIQDICESSNTMLGLVQQRDNGEKYIIARGTSGFPLTTNWSKPFLHLGGYWCEYLLTNTPITNCLETQSTNISNDLKAAEWNKAVIPIKNSVVIPIHYKDQMLGLISMSNRPNGFSFSLIDYIEPLISTFGMALKSLLDEEEKDILHAQLLEQATTDSLTGLPNRNALQHQIIELLASEDAPHYLYAHIDLDRFNLINNNHGHIAGDQALKQFAGFISNKFGNSARFYHFNGDKFAVLIEVPKNSSQEKQLQHLLDNIRAFRFPWDGNILSLNSSIGATAISKEDTAATLFKHADYACQIAKTTGRNRFQIFNAREHSTPQSKDDMALLAMVNSALENEQFTLYAQPICELSENRDAPELEILSRLINDQGEVLTPGYFLPTMERYGLSTLLDVYVVGKCMDWLQSLEHAGKRLPRVSINLSGQSLADPKFLNYLLDAIPRRGEYWHLICFEITETMAISNLLSAQKMIRKLKKRGCKFALDDFGSGLSSLSYLKDFNVDYLKIDGTFVIDICNDERDKAMIKSIHEMAKTLGMQTIAECAESDAIVDALKEIGIDYVQGFIFGKPFPVEEFGAQGITKI